MKSQIQIPVLQVLFLVVLAIANMSCGGSSPPVIVNVSPLSATVSASSTQPFTASTSNGSAVTWSVSCPSAPCGSVSPSSTASGQATTYTAPATVQANSMNVTVTANSQSSSAQASVTVPPYLISVSSNTNAIEPGTTAAFNAQVVGGPASATVTWSCSPSPCGSFAPTTTQNGAATTYTAPASTPLAGLNVTVTATSTANSSIYSSGSIQVYGVQVSVMPSSINVVAGQTQQFTAIVNNDPSSGGVNWTVTCGAAQCGGVSAPWTPSGTPITYTAPGPTPPASDLAVTVTATSVTYNPATAIANITVPAITVSVSPGSALIPLNSTQQFTATVGYDPANAGVTWILTQGAPPTPCSPGCGSVSNANPTTYTAPAAIPGSPANPYVTLTATSVTDTTKTFPIAIALSTGTVQLVPYSWNFGYHLVNSSSAPEPFTLTNTGPSALSVTSIAIAGTYADVYSQTNTCGSSVAAAGSCVISVTFKATQRGTRTATVVITDSSTDSPQKISVTGTGYTRGQADPLAVRSSLAGTTIAAVPLPTGPEPVGTRILPLIDSSREDPYIGHAMKREILVRFWYPSTPDESCHLADYTSPRVWNYFSQLMGVPLPTVVTNSCANARPADGAHPVVVFTPGYTGTFTDYTFLFEDLASRGYIVASVNHTYEATATEFPDGTFVKSLLGSHIDNSWRGDDKTLSLASSVRLRDLRFVLDELDRINKRSNDAFTGKFDLSRIAIAGHSAGGTIALDALERDARFKAAVILDSYFSPDRIHPTNASVFVLRAGSEPITDRCQLMAALHGPRVFVNLPGAEHLTPSDALWLAKGAIATGAMGPDRTVAAIRDYVAAFLDSSLRERPIDPLLTERSLIYPDASVTSGDEQSCRPQ